MSAAKAADLVTNLPELRKKISAMDEGQLATLLASMGNEGAANVLKRLGIDNRK
jgi:flagellar motility protein MotE (MotC chaperone)